MKTYWGPEGDERIWFEPEEIERIAEDELQKASLMPTTSNPVTDIERFIESYLGAELDQYAELPEDVLGLTLFTPTAAPDVRINGALTESADEENPLPGRKGRWRATMAHEATHILLHRHLFVAEFAGDSKGGIASCSEGDVFVAGSGELARSKKRSDWREVQANMGMAALLMPGRLFKRIARQESSRLSVVRPISGSSDADALAGAIAERCSVSRQAALIRLETLGVLRPSG